MIIVLKNADFSQSNIGTLSSWRISRSLGAGATYVGPASVDKDTELDAELYILPGYDISPVGITVTMGGILVDNAVEYGGLEGGSGNDGATQRYYIYIPSVTGNVVIKVPTVNTATGEEEEPDVPEALTLDSIAYGNKTYRDIFITNNIMPDINNNKINQNASGTLQYARNNTNNTFVIVQNDGTETNCVPPHSVHVSGTASTYVQKTGSVASGSKTYYTAVNIKVTNYNKGNCGIIIGTNNSGALTRTTTGYERHTAIVSVTGDHGYFLGATSSANLTGYLNNPVAVDSTIFGSTTPSQQEWLSLYNNYCKILSNN